MECWARALAQLTAGTAESARVVSSRSVLTVPAAGQIGETRVTDVALAVDGYRYAGYYLNASPQRSSGSSGGIGASKNSTTMREMLLPRGSSSRLREAVCSRTSRPSAAAAPATAKAAAAPPESASVAPTARAGAFEFLGDQCG